MTDQSKDPSDRFGIPDERIIKVIKAHDGVYRVGCYIPTRHEVATMEPKLLASILIDWWWESPTGLIPTDDQVAEVLQVLRSRPDADSPEIQGIIQEAPPMEPP